MKSYSSWIIDLNQYFFLKQCRKDRRGEVFQFDIITI